MKFVLLTPRGAVVDFWTEPLPDPPRPRRVLELMVEALRSRSRQQAGRAGRLSCLGLGAPGPLDHRRGRILQAANLPGWREVALTTPLRRALRVPVLLENDANAAAWGEWWKGAGRGAESLALFTVGTGIGGGIVTKEGGLWRGRWGRSAELGHMTIMAEGGKRCRCGNRGCLEAHASARALERAYRRETRRRIKARQLVGRARSGERAARRALVELGRALGVGVASVVHALDPERVLIGGGLSAAGELLMKPLREEFQRRATLAARQEVGRRIRLAQLGNRAGAIGAAGCAWKRFEACDAHT